MVMPTIMKFGGTSVADAKALENVAKIIASRVASVPVVVVSAMSRVTDSLLNSTVIASEARYDDAIASLENTFDRHIATAKEILSHDAANAYAKYVNDAEDQIAYFLKLIDSQLAQFLAVQDAVLAFGETLSSLLLASLLSERGVPAIQLDARACILTDDNYGVSARDAIVIRGEQAPRIRLHAQHLEIVPGDNSGGNEPAGRTGEPRRTQPLGDDAVKSLRLVPEVQIVGIALVSLHFPVQGAHDVDQLS